MYHRSPTTCRGRNPRCARHQRGQARRQRGAAPPRAERGAGARCRCCASTGIGKATAAELAQSGQYSRIFLAGHNEAKTRQAMKDLRAEVQLDYLPLELASLESVRQAAKTFQDSQLPLHTLICNAAVMAIPERQTTKDGFELQFEVNYLSHFLLVNLLIPQLASAGTKEDPARIISVSSSAHFVRSPLAFGDTDALNLEDSSGPRAYYPWTAYGQSKLAQVIFTYELARRLAERQLPVVANVLDPGIVDTELQRYLPTPAPTAVMRFAKSPKQGAETSVMLALEKTKTSGGYWVDGKKAESLGRGPPPLPRDVGTFRRPQQLRRFQPVFPKAPSS
eukprot:g26440.t2